jgi:hypothetical protein
LVEENTIFEIGARKKGYELSVATIEVLDSTYIIKGEYGYKYILFGRIDDYTVGEYSTSFTAVNVRGIMMQWDGQGWSSMIFHLKNKFVSFPNEHIFNGLISERIIIGVISY